MPIGTAGLTITTSDHVISSGQSFTLDVQASGATEVWCQPFWSARIDLSVTGGSIQLTPPYSGPVPVFAKDAAGGVVVHPASVIVKETLAALSITAPATFFTVQNGDLGIASTWGGTLPGPDGICEVRHACTVSGRTVRTGKITIIQGATLTVRDGVLYVTDLIVQGSLIIDGVGVQKSLVMLVNRPKHTGDTTNFGRVLHVQNGGTFWVLGNPVTPTVNLTAAAAIGATQFSVDAIPSGWGAGNKLLTPAGEVVVCRGIDGLTVKLLKPTTKACVASTANKPSVLASLIRNAGVLTIDPTTTATRGHVLIEGASTTLEMKHWLIHGTGRYTLTPYNTTNVLHRNPLQIYQNDEFIVEDGVSLDPLPIAYPSTVRFGIALRAANNGSVSRNVFFNWAGCGIFVEDGTEHDNVIDGNIVDDINGTGQKPNAYPGYLGHDGSGIWLRSAKNRVTNNTIRRCTKAGIIYYSQVIEDPILECRANFIETCGFGIWATNCGLSSAHSIMEDINIRECSTAGFANYVTQKLILRNFTIEDCKNGYQWGDYSADSHRVEGGTVTGCTVGMLFGSVHVGEPPVVEGVTLSGNGTDLQFATLRHNGGWTFCQPRNVQIVDCMLNSTTKVKMIFAAYGNGHYLLNDELHIVNWQGTSQDYRIYYAAQAAAAIVPTAPGSQAKGAEAPGLTNAQHFATYGTCVAGSVAACETPLAGVVGFACPE